MTGLVCALHDKAAALRRTLAYEQQTDNMEACQFDKPFVICLENVMM